MIFAPKSTIPFLDHINVTFAEVPVVDIRIFPVGGVDLSSIPGVSAWFQSAIRSAMLPYVTPGHISVNVTTMYSSPSCDERSGGTSNDVPADSMSGIVMVPVVDMQSRDLDMDDEAFNKRARQSLELYVKRAMSRAVDTALAGGIGEESASSAEQSESVDRGRTMLGAWLRKTFQPRQDAGDEL
jgi:hypothetical protein